MAGPTYGRQHRREKDRWRAAVESRTVRCARGADCKHAETVNGELVGGLVDPDIPWDLGHDDRNPGVYRGPEHPECNRATMSHRAALRRRPLERHPGLLP